MQLAWILILDTVYGNYMRMSRSGGNFDNFYFTVNGKFSLLFDTGSSHTWIVSNRFRHGGMDVARNRIFPCSRRVMYGSGNEISASQCVFGQLYSDKIAWESEVLVPVGPVAWWRHHGLVGASFESAFVKKHPVFTVAPSTDHMRLYTQNFAGSMAVFTPITSQEYGKWIVQGNVDVGMKRVNIELEIDTGYPAMSLSRSLWDEFTRVLRMNGGVLTGEIKRSYGHVVDKCTHATIPDVYYKFGDWRKRVESKYFVSWEKSNQCLVYVIVREPSQPYIYIGTPFLRSTITQFDAVNRRVGFRDSL